MLQHLVLCGSKDRSMLPMPSRFVRIRVCSIDGARWLLCFSHGDFFINLARAPPILVRDSTCVRGEGTWCGGFKSMRDIVAVRSLLLVRRTNQHRGEYYESKNEKTTCDQLHNCVYANDFSCSTCRCADYGVTTCGYAAYYPAPTKYDGA